VHLSQRAFQILLDALADATATTVDRVKEVVGAWILEVTKGKPYSASAVLFDYGNLAFNCFLFSLMSTTTVNKTPKVLAKTALLVSCLRWTPWLLLDDAHYTLHYTLTLHCTTLHSTALHCTPLLCAALQCNSMQYNALHARHTALHCTALHCTALHWSSATHTPGAVQCSAVHCTVLLQVCGLRWTPWLVLSQLLMVTPAFCFADNIAKCHSYCTALHYTQIHTLD
jgi:hypothetical protein